MVGDVLHSIAVTIDNLELKRSHLAVEYMVEIPSIGRRTFTETIETESLRIEIDSLIARGPHPFEVWLKTSRAIVSGIGRCIHVACNEYGNTASGLLLHTRHIELDTFCTSRLVGTLIGEVGIVELKFLSGHIVI